MADPEMTGSVAPFLRMGGGEREMAVSLKSWPRWYRSRQPPPLGVAAVKEVYQRGGLSGCRTFSNTEESGWDLVGEPTVYVLC